jgi:predicted phosphodiesterase
MRIAFLSDIHGNAIALDRCLERLQKLHVDASHFLGDAVGYMPAADEVLNRLQREQVHCQQGNHEEMLLCPTALSRERERIYRLQQTRALLEPEQLRMVASWPTSRELTLRGRSLLLVHGSPRSMLDGYVYPDTDLAEYHRLRHDAVVMGHTHPPFVRQSGGKTRSAESGSRGSSVPLSSTSALRRRQARGHTAGSGQAYFSRKQRTNRQGVAPVDLGNSRILKHSSRLSCRLC